MTTKLNQFEKTLQDLVSIRSISGEKQAAKEIIDYVKQRLRGRSLYMQEFHDDGYPILLLTTRRGKKPKILFVAHGDVLAAPDPLFRMRADDSKLYGRGVWDMKFAIAGYIELIEQLADKLTEYDFGILITSDEETRNQNVEYILGQDVRPEIVVLPDGSSNWQVESAAKGAWTVELTARGKTAHGSRPWEGQSASVLLLDALHEIRSWFRDQAPDTDTLNIATLNAGIAPNQLPAHASACLDMRFVSRAGRRKIGDLLEKLVNRSDLSIRTVVDMSPLEHDLSNNYVAKFVDSANEVAGAPRKGMISFGASDAAYFARLGIPCIVTRPEGGGHHGDDEWVSRESLALMVPVLVNFLDRLNM